MGSIIVITLLIGISPVTAQDNVFQIRHAEMPSHFCMLPNVYTAADETQTNSDSWLQLSLDKLAYAGDRIL
ncbi:MAG: hypothetical protein AAB520_00320, partial [Patescibacteria group bacterium]